MQQRGMAQKSQDMGSVLEVYRGTTAPQQRCAHSETNAAVLCKDHHGVSFPVSTNSSLNLDMTDLPLRCLVKYRPTYKI